MTATDAGWFSDETATFGDRLAAAREQAGLSQKELATRLGVKTATMAAWEDDLKEPRANRLQMLSGMLGVSLNWLMTGQGDGPTGPVEEVDVPDEVIVLLDRIRATRVEISEASERLAKLEKRLRKAVTLA